MLFDRVESQCPSKHVPHAFLIDMCTVIQYHSCHDALVCVAFRCVAYRPRSFLEAGFRPLCSPFVYFVPLSRTKPAFWNSTITAPGPISQVLPGCRVRHPQYSKMLFVRTSLQQFSRMNLQVDKASKLLNLATENLRVDSKSRNPERPISPKTKGSPRTYKSQTKSATG